MTTKNCRLALNSLNLRFKKLISIIIKLLKNSSKPKINVKSVVQSEHNLQN